MTRIVTGAVLLPLLWVILMLAPPSVFLAIALVAISIAVFECYRMLERGGWRPFVWLGLLATWGVIWSFSGREPTFQAVLPHGRRWPEMPSCPTVAAHVVPVSSA